jgi:hypothetical protein
MGRDALLLIALLAGCPKQAEAPPRMRDARVLEVAQSCARAQHEGKGAGGCALLLDAATIDDAKAADGSHVFRVEFDEERCGKPRFQAGLVLEIDDGGTCKRVRP